MQNQYISYGIQGIYQVADYALRWDMSNTTAQYRHKILCFWDKHGLQATIDAFAVSRRTLYLWKRLYREAGLSGLTPKPKTPKRKRQRQWPEAVVVEIKRLRRCYPNLGKEKLYPLLKVFCESQQYRCPSVSSIVHPVAEFGYFVCTTAKNSHIMKRLLHDSKQNSILPILMHPGNGV